ncbi:MAG: flagellar basal body-associated FliL family protein [Bacteroidales bacterium]|nr:flagellar basal body-associated FliL family protein [Candidatus Latescibacterota bacterium]
MADEEKGEVEEKEKKKKKNLLANPIVLIAIIVVFQALIALMMVKMLGSDKADVDARPVEEKEVLAEEKTRGTIVMLENIVVNLKEREKLYYLKMTIGVEVPDNDVKDEVTERHAQLRDDVISLLSGKKVSDIDTLEERNLLKVDITRRINESLITGDIMQLYFSDFVIQ